jgi:parallel beta helix pectate lyase-like protein
VSSELSSLSLLRAWAGKSSLALVLILSTILLQGCLSFLDNTVPQTVEAIQNSIDAAMPGSTVLIPAGTYYGHLTLNKSVELRGERMAKDVVILAFLPNLPVIQISGDTKTEIRISDLTVGGAFTDENYEGRVDANSLLPDGIDVRQSPRVYLDRVNFAGSDLNGLDIWGGARVTVSNCSFNNGYNGLVSAYGAVVDVRNCQFEGNVHGASVTYGGHLQMNRVEIGHNERSSSDSYDGKLYIFDSEITGIVVLRSGILQLFDCWIVVGFIFNEDVILEGARNTHPLGFALHHPYPGYEWPVGFFLEDSEPPEQSLTLNARTAWQNFAENPLCDNVSRQETGDVSR